MLNSKVFEVIRFRTLLAYMPIIEMKFTFKVIRYVKYNNA